MSSTPQEAKATTVITTTPTGMESSADGRRGRGDRRRKRTAGAAVVGSEDALMNASTTRMEASSTRIDAESGVKMNASSTQMNAESEVKAEAMTDAGTDQQDAEVENVPGGTGMQRRRRTRRAKSDEDVAANSAHADASQEPAAQVEAQVASQDAEEQPKSNRRRSAKRRARPTSSDKDVVATSAPTAPSNATATPTLDDPTNPFRALGKSPTDFVNRAVSVQIHRADALRFDVKYISRPVVRVHVLDTRTGTYFAKSDGERRVSSYYEHHRTTTILPVQTKPFALRAVHSTAPAWEEELLLNEDYLYLIQPHTLLLFEVLDLLSPGAVAAGGADTADGWDPVAWAFLRPVGAHNVANTEEVKRLQLWEYPSRGILERFSGRHSAADAASRTVHRLFHSWSGDGSKRKAYPATLHVTVEACPVPAYHQITGRAYRPNEIETGRVPLDKLLGKQLRASKGDLHDTGDIATVASPAAPIPWRRLYSQRCQVPNKLLFRIATGRRGCTALSFSSSGFYLALATTSNQPTAIVTANATTTLNNTTTTSPSSVKIYDTQTGQRITTLQGHTDLIKEVYWSPDEHHLLTVSADGTARVYDVWRERVNAPVLIAVLQHPVGVATGSFVNLGGESDDDDSSAKFVVTGAKDGGIRVWAIPEDVVVASPGTARYSTATGATGRPHSALGQNLPTLDHNLPIAALMGDAHGPTTTKTLPSVQSVVTDMDGKRMFSGDTEGTIKVWVNEGRGAVPMFRCAQTIAVENGVTHPINNIALHPSGRHLLVHTRDHIIRLLDLRLMNFTRYYELPPSATRMSGGGGDAVVAGMVTRLSSKAIFSPCGNHVYVPGANGLLYVYNMDTSALIATYPPSLGDAPITALAFHPFDHMLACAAPGEPVEVYTFDEQTPSMERVSGATAVESQQPQQAVGGATGRETAAYMYASAMASPMARVGSPMSRVGNTGRLETATRQLAMETAAMRLSTAGSVLTGAALN